MAPIVTISPTVSKLLARAAKGEKIHGSELARVLAAIGAHIEHGVAVPAHFQPVEVISLIGKALVSSEMWSKLYNAESAEAARVKTAQWQREANKLFEKNPHLSKSQAAKRIAPHKWETVRKAITKPKK